MPKLDIKINSSISIVSNGKLYKAVVISTEDNKIKIKIPVNNDSYLMLAEGDKVNISSCVGSGNCFMYSCDVVSRGKLDSELYYELTQPYNIQKVQRRNFYRIEMLQDIEYKNITNKTPKESNKIPYEKCTMLDLSGGGARIRVDEMLNKDDIVVLKIELSAKKLELKGQIVRAEKPNNSNSWFIYGVKFIDIADTDTDTIVKEIFEITRKHSIIST